MLSNKVKKTQVPKVSVIIPVYNTERYLRECLNSVINQTLKDIEIICVDDGSTDNSLELLQEYANKDNRITVITQKNRGLSAARNTGLKYVNSEYVIFVDSDDYLAHDTLFLLFDDLIKTNSDVSVGSVKIFGDVDKEFIEQKQKWFDRFYTKEGKHNIEINIRGTICPTAWNKLYKMSIINKFDIRFPEGLINEDEYWLWAYMIHCDTYTINHQNTYFYRQRKNSIMEQRFTNNTLLDIIDVHKELVRTLKKHKLFDKYKCVISSWFKIQIDSIINQIPLVSYGDALKKIQNYVKKYNNSCDLIEYLKSVENKLSVEIIKKNQNNFIPKVSVIIPVYNTEKYLQECLNSVINQTLKDIEIICVDDGSTDGSLKILKNNANKDSRITILKQTNMHQGSARNNGIKTATGEYIFFVDADDWIKENACEILYNHAKKYDFDMINFEGIKYINDTKTFEEIPQLKINYFSDENRVYSREHIENIADKLTVSSCLMFYKKSFIDANNLLFPVGLFFEDNIFVHGALNVARKYGIKKSSLYFRRIHSAQTTQKWSKLFSDYIKIVKMLSDFYINKSSFKSVSKENVINNYISDAIHRWMLFKDCDKLRYISELYYTLYPVSQMIHCNQDVVTFFDKYNPTIYYKNDLISWWFKEKQQPLNLDNPKTFNEKLQWLKLYNSIPQKTKLADKYLVRDWVANKIGDKYLVPVYGVFNNFDGIDFDKMPKQFVIKTTHGSGWNIIVKNKKIFNKDDAKKQIDAWLESNFAFVAGCELHYRNIKPRIIIEKYIDPSESDREIQVWCFNGKIKFVSVESIKDAKNLVRGTFYPDGTQTEFQISPNHYKKLDNIPDKKAFDKAITLAEKMLIDVPYVRIDFIEMHGDVLFREMTFTSGSGLSTIEPKIYNRILGNWIKLPKKAYNIDTDRYYKLPRQHKHWIIKPYTMFLYYFIKTVYMKYKLSKLRKNK